MEAYKRKRLKALQGEIKSIESGTNSAIRRKILKSERARNEKLVRAERRRDQHAELAEMGTQKEMDDIKDWWKVEAKRCKDELCTQSPLFHSPASEVATRAHALRVDLGVRTAQMRRSATASTRSSASSTCGTGRRTTSST